MVKYPPTWLHNPFPTKQPVRDEQAKFWEESCMHAFLAVSFMRARSRRNELLGGIDGRACSKWIICTVVSLHVRTHPAYNNHHPICSIIMFKPLRPAADLCSRLVRRQRCGSFFIYFISVWSFWHSDEWKWRGLYYTFVYPCCGV